MNLPAQSTEALTLEDATLPVIDLSGLYTGEEESVSKALGEAARNSGFFYITGHGIPESLIESLFAASEQFHSMPRSYKMKYWCGFSFRMLYDTASGRPWFACDKLAHPPRTVSVDAQAYPPLDLQGIELASTDTWNLFFA